MVRAILWPTISGMPGHFVSVLRCAVLHCAALRCAMLCGGVQPSVAHDRVRCAVIRCAGLSCAGGGRALLGADEGGAPVQLQTLFSKGGLGEPGCLSRWLARVPDPHLFHTGPTLRLPLLAHSPTPFPLPYSLSSKTSLPPSISLITCPDPRSFLP